MRVRFFATWVFVMLAVGACAGADVGAGVGPATRPAGAVDFLDYFLQSDDVDERWTIGGTDVRPAPRDPDGTTATAAAGTVILSKFSSPDCYEVFKITDSHILIRYEVMRWGGAKGTENWIRRFSGSDGGEGAAGAVWMNRWVVPGGAGVLSRFRQDKWVFDAAGRQYVIDRAGSDERMETYAWCAWADVTWPMGDETGFGIDRVLRLVSEWQREGMMVETYDYAKGKGLVGWRWLERISTLKPLKDDPAAGKVFHCEEGLVYVEKDGPRPRAWRYDAGEKGRELDVVEFQSHWKPELGKQWYVVYRDLSREQKLIRKTERIAHDFALPECEAVRTISDLHGLHTR